MTSLKEFLSAFAFVFVVATANRAAAQEEAHLNEDYAPLPEYRVFGEPATASDEEAIDELMQRFGKAWSTQSVEATVAAYTEDAEWTNAFAAVYRGHEELRDRFTWLFERFGSGPEEDAEEEEKPALKRGKLSLRYLGDDAAVIHSYTESDWAGNRDGREIRRVHVTYVLEKQEDGEWLIAHQMIMDARR